MGIVRIEFTNNTPCTCVLINNNSSFMPTNNGPNDINIEIEITSNYNNITDNTINNYNDNSNNSINTTISNNCSNSTYNIQAQ